MTERRLPLGVAEVHVVIDDVHKVEDVRCLRSGRQRRLVRGTDVAAQHHIEMRAIA